MALERLATEAQLARFRSGTLVDYVRPDSGADAQSLRSMLAAAGHPAGETAADLTRQVRAFQTQHGLRVDGRAGPETLGALRALLASRLEQAETPSTLSDAQAQAFVTSREAIARAPTAEQIARNPREGQARPAGTPEATRTRLEAALRQQQAAAAAQEPMTPGEAQVEAAAELARRPPPSRGDLIRSAHEGRTRLAQRENELRRMASEPVARPDPTWQARAQALEREIEATRAELRTNPMNAVFDRLEQAHLALREAERLGRGWGGAGRSREESDRRIATARERVALIAAELGLAP